MRHLLYSHVQNKAYLYARISLVFVNRGSNLQIRLLFSMSVSASSDASEHPGAVLCIPEMQAKAEKMRGF